MILVKSGFFKQLDLPCDSRKEYNLSAYAMLEVSFITCIFVFPEKKVCEGEDSQFSMYGHQK